MNRKLVFTVVSCFALVAHAQLHIACPERPNPKMQNQKCSAGVRGDPVVMLSGQTLDLTTDFDIGVGDDRFRFGRTFASGYSNQDIVAKHVGEPGGYGWNYDLPAPFGVRPGGWAPVTFHSLQSAIWATADGTRTLVLLPEMYWNDFTTTCMGGSSPCFLSPIDSQRGTLLRLQRLGAANSGRYILIREDGEHWRFEPDPASGQSSPPTGFVSRLTSVEDRLGRTRFTVTYSAHASCVSDAGIPPTQIDRVNFRNGSHLEFTYVDTFFGATRECVLSTVRFHAGQPESSQTLVTYTYDSNFRVASVARSMFPNEMYTEGPVGDGGTYFWWASTPGLPARVTHQREGGTGRTSLSSGIATGTNFSASYSSNSSTPTALLGSFPFVDGGVCLASNELLTPSYATSYQALPSPSATTTRTLAYFGYVERSVPGKPGQDGLSVAVRCDASGDGGCVPSTATGFFPLGSAANKCDSSDSVSSITMRPGGRFENITRWRADGGGVSPGALGDAVPLYSARGGVGFQGALTSSQTPLAGALETTFYNGGESFNGSTFFSAGSVYDVYGSEPSHGRRWDTTQRYSTILSVGRAENWNDGDLRTGWMAEVSTGFTKQNDGGTTVRMRKTVSYTYRVCEASSPDPSARVLRREGPCWWNSSTSACESSEPFPTTEYHYFAATDPGFKAGRLRYVKRYPNRSGASCGSALTTEFVDYDADGHPTTVIDEAGITTVYTYSAGRLTSRTVMGALADGGSATTTYTYETNGELRHIQFPEGNYLVYCRHDSSYSGFCDYTQPLLPKLQWIAKSTSVDGSGATEKQTFEYGFGNNIGPTDGPLRLTKFYDSTGALRRQVNSYTDTDERITHTSVGTLPTTGASTTRSFDIADNLAAVGGSFAGAPELCAQSPGVLSPLCVWFTHDRADRLAQVDANPTGAVSSTESIRTCIDYDQQGNVRHVARGCSTSGSCAVNSIDGGISSCVNSVIDYDVDDFGDTVSVNGPWRADTAAKSLTRYEYNARGLVTKKTTQSMAAAGTWLQYTYDAADRPLTVSKEGAGGSVLLYAFGYDTGNPGTGCPSLSNRGGRLAYRSDSFGVTWYSYDAEGRVTMELRQRAGSQGSCSWGGSPYINNPHTTYTYTPNGNLKSVQYPYGRTVSYGYNGTDRPTSISVSVWDVSTTTPTTYTVVSGISWEPFGGLRSYTVATGTNFNGAAGVEYYRGPLQGGDTPATSTTGISCASPSMSTTSDATGRTRALLVTNPSRFSPKGDIFRQVYTWASDQLVREQTCVGRLGQTTETSQEFTYDKTLRLTGSTGSTEYPRVTAPVNPSPAGERVYAYDRRGNRTGYSTDKCSRNNNYLTGVQEDVLISLAPVVSDPECSNPISGWTFLSDADGRAYHKSTYNAWWVANLNYSPTSTSSGLDSVVKSVTIDRAGAASTSYTYRYDAFNRRRLKTYPFDADEEFFYDVGQQLLTQRSGNLVGTPTQYTVDDYIWLDSKPIAMVRGSFSTAFARNLDTQASCDRFGEAGACGVYHVVHDILPKPVLMLQASTGKISNVALYDDFGNVNRIPVIARRGSPWASTTVATVTLPTGSATQQYLPRAFHNVVDLPAGMSVTVNGSVPVSGNTKAAVWSAWAPATTSNQIQIALSTTACGTECSRNGTQSEAVEYRRYESGATPMWTTMRFPGQQYDLETDLHENWNRFYEPMLGRYLSPEPQLLEQELALHRTRRGLATPSYSYAVNSPLANIDPDGLQSLAACGRQPWACAAADAQDWELAQQAKATAAAAAAAAQTAAAADAAAAAEKAGEGEAGSEKADEKECEEKRVKKCQEAESRALRNCLLSGSIFKLGQKIKSCPGFAGACFDSCILGRPRWKKECLQDGPKAGWKPPK